jgi:stage II sporulation protein D
MLTWALCLAAPLWGATPSTGTAVARPERRITLGLYPRVDEVSLVTEGVYGIVDADGKSHEIAAGQRLRLEPWGRGLRLGSYVLGREARLKPRASGALVVIDDKRYGGALLFRLDPAGDTVTVIEEIGIEDYLLGVLPFEMQPDWPLEALKAQAVVARTFAYTQFGKYKKEGFDLSTDTRSQVYGGRGSDNDRIRAAVRETRGEVLGYKGEILNVYYHACCGGHTQDVARVWGGEASPPLRGVKDPYCRYSPLRVWTSFFSYNQLINAVLKRRLTGETMSGFELGRVDKAGYALSFIARVGAETIKVKAADLRSGLGGGALRSVRITRLKRLRRGIEFVGSGAGHGVGLCQWGARLQAQRDRRYEQILSFYFPGSTLSEIDE